ECNAAEPASTAAAARPRSARKPGAARKRGAAPRPLASPVLSTRARLPGPRKRPPPGTASPSPPGPVLLGRALNDGGAAGDVLGLGEAPLQVAEGVGGRARPGCIRGGPGAGRDEPTRASERV